MLMNVPNEKDASNLRKYFVEYTVLFLVSAVALLFYMYVNLSNKVLDLQTNVIQKNTEEIHNFIINKQNVFSNEHFSKN